MNINWYLKHFKQLTTTELYQILQLRSAVFVVEQNCPFQDMDGKDVASYHYMGFDTASQQIVAYTRLVPPGGSFPEASIGRVVTATSARKHGVGRELMSSSINLVEELFGGGNIRIGAQLYLKSFYGSFGFEQSGDIYLEDGIEHIEMLRIA